MNVRDAVLKAIVGVMERHGEGPTTKAIVTASLQQTVTKLSETVYPSLTQSLITALARAST